MKRLLLAALLAVPSFAASFSIDLVQVAKAVKARHDQIPARVKWRRATAAFAAAASVGDMATTYRGIRRGGCELNPFLQLADGCSLNKARFNRMKIGTGYAGLGSGVAANTVAIEGKVGIGTTAPVYGLDVAKSGASGTARFYDQTATTGATRVLITLGAADTTSTQVFEIGGLMKFSGLNSTGAGTALLSTNSPAVTNTAPYTWFKVLTSDGSTGYIPVWK